MIVVVVDLRATDESMDSIIVIHFIFFHIVMSKKISLSLSLFLFPRMKQGKMKIAALLDDPNHIE